MGSVTPISTASIGLATGLTGQAWSGLAIAGISGTPSTQEECARCNSMGESISREFGAPCSGNQCIDLGPALADNGKASLLEVQMDWSCFAEELYVGDWRVEGRDHENEGQVYVAIFSGPKARERAKEYADWQISKEQLRSRLHRVS